MRLPNFFIVGAPKCGTTALSEYLRAHPQIFMSRPKEPNYFLLDLPGTNRPVKEWDSYLKLFSSARPSQTAVGEASAWYMYSKVAIPELIRRLPEARIIVLLRDPIELALSMHAQQLSMSYEVERSFEKAWHKCEQRRQGRGVPATCPNGKELLYDEIPLLGQQLKRILEYVPRENIHCYFYEDFRNDPGRIYREVLEFLEVPDDGRREFKKVNPRKHTRSLLLAQLTQQPPSSLTRSAAWIKRRIGVERLGVLRALRRLNYQPAPAATLPSILLSEMRDHFASDVALLQSLTGRNLQHWLSDASVKPLGHSHDS